MTTTIWKFPLQVIDKQVISMPKDAIVLTVQVQGSQPCLWARLSPDTPSEKRTFLTYGTGHEIESEPGPYIGTYQLEGGQLVFHVFESRGG